MRCRGKCDKKARVKPRGGCRWHSQNAAAANGCRPREKARSGRRDLVKGFR